MRSGDDIRGLLQWLRREDACQRQRDAATLIEELQDDCFRQVGQVLNLNLRLDRQEESTRALATQYADCNLNLYRATGVIENYEGALKAIANVAEYTSTTREDIRQMAINALSRKGKPKDRQECLARYPA